jgi:hypothetical protein
MTLESMGSSMEFTEKRQRIEAISDEVGELHPLLQNVFPKMSNVKSFEYTHGQFERGADFVVEIESATTNRRAHVGVVVKCGKIGSAKSTDIEEQIRECAEERSYKVMNRVRCTEVWVFASGGYSERAKEKLRDRFPGRNVEFFGPEDIAQFVDSHFGYYWQNLPHEIGVYFHKLRTRLDVLDKATDLLASSAAEGSYIELDTYERLKKGYTKGGGGKAELKNASFLKEALETRLGLLEAEMGFGKSKLARRLASSLCQSESYRRHRLVPVFSSYKLFVDDYQGDLQNLARQHLGEAASCLDDSEVEVLVILDGIDECSSLEQTSSSYFEELASQLKDLPKYRAIVTSRPLRSLVDKAALYGNARTFGIRPLSLAKIVKYLEATCSKQRLPARLFEDLKRSPLFKQLPHSPIAATLFSNLLAQSQQEVPQSLTELYSKSMELMLGRWEQKKELATEKQFKTVQLIAEQLACYFVENRLIYVAQSEVDQIVSDYLARRNVGVGKEVVDTLLFGRSNIFSIDEEQGIVAFRHRSFAEYLCAQKKARDRSLEVRKAALEPYWTNVFFFYVGTLLDCPEVLAQLRTMPASDEIEEWMKIISVPNYLLAAYQTEFDEVEANVQAVLLETAKLFLRVRSGDTKTRLPDLTEMQLLYLFKGLVTQSLGYDFFSRGFDAIALGLDDANEDKDIRIYALFFLSCAALSCGNDSGFKYLVHTIGAHAMPLTVSLATKCELESASNLEKSNLLKYHKDKLRKLLTASAKMPAGERLAMQSRIDELFEKPMSARKNHAARAIVAASPRPR